MAHKLALIAHTVVLICLLPLFLQSTYSSSALVSVNPSSFFNPPNSLSSSSSARALAQKQSHRCYPPDIEALQEVAASAPAPVADHGLRLLWPPEQDCCSWTGVTCGAPLISYSSTLSSNRSATPMYFRVVGLMLADIFSGAASTTSKLTFPLAICRLSALTSLDLTRNHLIGPIPTCLGHNLTSLKTLVLNENYFSGLITPLANLSLLTRLDLSSNALSGPVSPLKLQMPRLQFLDLSGNSLSGSLSFIDGLSDLQHLSLFENSLNISLSPAVFSSTPRLRYLSLFEVLQITGDIRSLEHLQHLEVLYLTMTVPEGSLGSLFCKLGSLQEMSVSADIYAASYQEDAADTINGVLNDKLCEKPASVNLNSLVLFAQGYKGPFPAWFGEFIQLQYLDLSLNQFKGSIPQEWQALTQLTYLSLSGNSLRVSTPVSLSEEVQISWLFRLPLEGLNLESTGLMSQDFPCAGFSLLNHTLRDLDLSYNHISPGHSLMHCLQHHNFSRLRFLDLSKNPLALQVQLCLFPQYHIEILGLSFCQLSGSLPANNLGPNLDWLDLSSNQLTGRVPSSVWNVSSAVILDNNHLHGKVVPNPGLINAGMVTIANNHLSEAFFHNVSHLEVLDLSGNQLHGSLETLLGDYSVMRHLTALILYDNQLSGPIPISLGTSAPSLIAVDLSNNQLTGAIPHSLQHLQALLSKGSRRLANLSYSLESVKNVKFTVWSYLNFPRGHLDLSSNQLNGVIPDGLGALVGLNDLNLSRNQLSGPIPRSLAHLSSLESLDLSFNNLQGAIPPEFSTLHALEVFNVSFNPELSGQIPEGPQLETATSYEGDDELCGQTLKKDCKNQQAEAPSLDVEPDTQEFGTHKSFLSVVKLWIEEWTAIPAIFIGYALGLGLTIWALKLLHFYK